MELAGETAIPQEEPPRTLVFRILPHLCNRVSARHRLGRSRIRNAFQASVSTRTPHHHLLQTIQQQTVTIHLRFIHPRHTDWMHLEFLLRADAHFGQLPRDVALYRPHPLQSMRGDVHCLLRPPPASSR